MTIAARLVNELMLVSVLVAGEGAAALAADLEAAGADAQSLSDAGTQAGVDLAILLADPAQATAAATRDLVVRLSAASERLLFAPPPLGGAVSGAALPELTAWFEVFAEFGYQPVIEFDASFVSPGAFLVDRAATADEGDLAAFADRLQHSPGASPGSRPATAIDTSPEMRARAERDLLQSRLTAAEADTADTKTQLAGSRAEALAQAGQIAALHAALRSSEDRNAGWDGLRAWVRAAAGDPARDSVAALVRDLPRLNAWRAPAAPMPHPAPRGFWRRRAPTLPILADAALVRASPLFDAAWYVASQPELAQIPPVDPVFHYLLVGSPRGADPGPWFDSAAYHLAHPDVLPRGINPLVHAIRTGAVESQSATAG